MKVQFYYTFQISQNKISRETGHKFFVPGRDGTGNGTRKFGLYFDFLFSKCVKSKDHCIHSFFMSQYCRSLYIVPPYNFSIQLGVTVTAQILIFLSINESKINVPFPGFPGVPCPGPSRVSFVPARPGNFPSLGMYNLDVV